MASFENVISTDDIILVKMLSMLNAEDVVSCLQVSKSLQAIILSSSDLWYTLACHRYGKRLVVSTSHLYKTTLDCPKNKNTNITSNNKYHAMLVDDNRRGALPTLLHIPPCRWKYNHNSRQSQQQQHVYSCCHIPCMQWNRITKQVYIYFDVKGESTLRHLSTAGQLICVPNTEQIVMMQVTGKKNTDSGCTSQRRRRITYQPTACHVYHDYHQDATIPCHKHYQGYLVFPEAYFHTAGTYYFGYQQQQQHGSSNGGGNAWTDYKASKLLQVTTEGFGLAEFRDLYQGVVYYTGLDLLTERSSVIPDNAKEKIVTDDDDPDNNHLLVKWMHARNHKNKPNDASDKPPVPPSSSCLTLVDLNRILLAAACAATSDF